MTDTPRIAQDLADLELTRSLAGSVSDGEQELGLLLSEHLKETLSDLDPQTRARVVLRTGQFISQIAAKSRDGSGMIWGNAVLVASVNQDA